VQIDAFQRHKNNIDIQHVFLYLLNLIFIMTFKK